MRTSCSLVAAILLAGCAHGPGASSCEEARGFQSWGTGESIALSVQGQGSAAILVQARPIAGTPQEQADRQRELAHVAIVPHGRGHVVIDLLDQRLDDWNATVTPWTGRLNLAFDDLDDEEIGLLLHADGPSLETTGVAWTECVEYMLNVRSGEAPSWNETRQDIGAYWSHMCAVRDGPRPVSQEILGVETTARERPVRTVYGFGPLEALNQETPYGICLGRGGVTEDLHLSAWLDHELPGPNMHYTAIIGWTAPDQ